MEKIQVLMSTYNGEAYVQEQIDSILNQHGVEVELLIRDDGSSDGTLSRIGKYLEENDNVSLIKGENVGVTDSFFELLAIADAEFIAFADQDDIWLPDKLRVAVQRLKREVGPALYASNKILVDRYGKIIKENDKRKPAPSFANALVESICTGCTIVMNRELLLHLQKKIPKHAILHDWWCYLVAGYLGTVVYDEDSYIYYRQHGSNAVGEAESALQRIKRQICYVRENRGRLGAQLREFRELYYGSKAKDEMVQKVLAAEKMKDRCRLIFSKGIKRQNIFDDFMMRGLFLMGWML